MYYEKIRPWFFYAYLCILLLVLAIIGLWIYLASIYDWAKDPSIMIIGMSLPFLVLMGYFAWAINHFRILTTFKSIQIGFPGYLWSIQLDYRDIGQAEIVDIKWVHWGGMGPRKRFGNQIGYILGSGKGVLISKNANGKTYTFNCKDPVGLLAILAEHNVAIASSPESNDQGRDQNHEQSNERANSDSQESNESKESQHSKE